MEGRCANIPLRPGDRLVIPLRPDFREGSAVSVDGEAVRPGTYPIAKYSTKLSDVIHAAGGFTKDAFVKGAMLLRARLSPLELPDEIQRERLLSLRTGLASEDSAYYLTETELRIKGGEIVAVDFHKLFVEGDTTQDVTLRNYDRIVIPFSHKTIYVFGQVIDPGHVQLKEGEGYRYYVDRAGGFTKDARTSDVKVIKGSNRTWLDPGETVIEDGDYIWVPKEVHYPFGSYLVTIAQLATVLAALATVILVIKTL
jgi:protein involved in polysaccharide export with SLBB domain